MLAAGQELSARFVLVRTLGRGGSGEVWLARDLERGRLVAVQVLAPALVDSAQAWAAIVASCERAQQLEHPNVLRIDGLFREGRRAWITMEHAAGGDLGTLRGRPAAEVLTPAIDVAKALAYLHGQGLVHRDVKTSNVLIAQDGSARLGDFSALLSIGASPDSAVSLGSPYSASPEQLDGSPAARADDVYAFGVLLYELLCGYPPFYPEITAERVRTEMPAVPSGKQPIPQSLIELTMRCLAKQPVERPRDFAEILAVLESVRRELRAAAPALEPPTGQSAPIRPQWQRPAVTHGRSERELRGEGFRRGLLVAAGALLAVVAAVVFFVLPDWVQSRRPAVEKVTPAAEIVATEPEPEPEVDYAALAQLQREAEELRAAVDPRITALGERGAERWGQPRFDRARELIASGDTAFAAREYAAANAAFEEATAIATALETEAPEVLSRTLAEGERALEAGRSSDAERAFELALTLEPENARAQSGAKRAATLDEVLALVTSGEQHEREGELDAARTAFAQAIELDEQMARAREGLDRVSSQLADDAYRTVLARGFAAQASGDREAARRAFEEARKMRPGAAEPQRALAQLEQEARTDRIADRLASARELESRERWQEALDAYKEILAIDSTVAFAQDGAARTAPRDELHDQLELYLTQPERLFSAPVRAAARGALAKASQIKDPGPVLTRQMRTLDDWLRRAETPVAVALQSDNVTRVTIFRVGDLGTFEQRSLELMPGKYTAVGTRPGYRDVRREFTVLPGSGPALLEIRCEERI